MIEVLTCFVLVGSGFGAIGLWLLVRRLIEQELRLELLEEIELRRNVLPIGQGRPTLTIAENGPDLAA